MEAAAAAVPPQASNPSESYRIRTARINQTVWEGGRARKRGCERARVVISRGVCARPVIGTRTLVCGLAADDRSRGPGRACEAAPGWSPTQLEWGVEWGLLA